MKTWIMILAAAVTCTSAPACLPDRCVQADYGEDFVDYQHVVEVRVAPGNWTRITYYTTEGGHSLTNDHIVPGIPVRDVPCADVQARMDAVDRTGGGR